MSDRGTPLPDDADPSETHSEAPSPGSAAAGARPVRDTWGDLRILNEIGRGGFGSVYRAWDETLQREVALKIIEPRNGTHRVDLLLREGQMLARVKHPHVVTVFRAQRVGDEVGFTMELIKGRHLSTIVAEAGPMGADEAAVIGVHLCQAIAAVHGAGLLHRDIKTRNVMREAGGRIVLMDFGAGREVAPNAPVSDLQGTVPYMAPELFAGGTASTASDLYSLGVLLFFLVTGEYPVEGRTLADFAFQHNANKRRLLADRRPDLPSAFVQVIDRALAPKPEHRYQSAGAFMRELSEAVRLHRPSPDLIHEAIAPAPPAPDPLLRRWMVRALGAVAVILAIAMLGFLTTIHYDRALSRDAGMTGEHIGTWFVFGFRSLVPLAVFTFVVYLAARLVLAVWHFTRRAIPRLGKATDLARSSITSWFAPDITSTAQALLLAEVAVIAVWAVVFWPMLGTMTMIVDEAPVETLALLDSGTSNGLLYGYRTMLMPLLAVGAMGWRWLLVQSPARATVPRGAAVAGVGLLIAALLLLEIPHRLFYRSEGYRGTYKDATCYEIATNRVESQLFCPDAPEKQRIKTVKSSEFLNKTGIKRIFGTPGTTTQ